METNVNKDYIILEKELLTNNYKKESFLNYKDSEGNTLFHYLIFYNKINIFKKLFKHGDLTIKNNNGHHCFNIELQDFNFIKNINKYDKDKRITNSFNDKDNIELSIFNMSILIYNYNILIQAGLKKTNLDKKKDINNYKFILHKFLTSDLNSEYKKNDLLLLFNNQNITEKGYPYEVIHNCINLYYEYNLKKNNIPENSENYLDIQENILELNDKNVDNCRNKYINIDIDLLKNILKNLDHIYIEHKRNIKKGLKINKDIILKFNKFLFDYIKDNNDDIIGNSQSSYLKETYIQYFIDKTSIHDENKLLNHPFINYYNIKYFIENINLRDAFIIVKELLIKPKNNLPPNIYSNLYLTYFNIVNSNENILDNKFLDYKNLDRIFDIPKELLLDINNNTIHIINGVLPKFPFYHFYIEFIFFIRNITDGNNLNSTKKYLNDWEYIPTNNNNYFLHKNTSKILTNCQPQIDTNLQLINIINNPIVLNIFSNIIYGYEHNYIEKLYNFMEGEMVTSNLNPINNSNKSIKLMMTNEEIDFIYECLDFLKPNPRKIKRILNIISLTRYIIDNTNTQLNEEQLISKQLLYKLIIKFIILFEQWPYRATWLYIWVYECYENKDNFHSTGFKKKWFPGNLENIINKYNKDNPAFCITNFLKSISLRDFFFSIENYLFKTEKLSNLAKMDCDPDDFYDFLDKGTCNNNNNLKKCFDIIYIEKINFNHNPAIFATCKDEINRLQNIMKYKLEFKSNSNTLIKDIQTNGLLIRNNTTYNSTLWNNDNCDNDNTNAKQTEENIKIIIK
jgi:hypothetical protein